MCLVNMYLVSCKKCGTRKHTKETQQTRKYSINSEVHSELLGLINKMNLHIFIWFQSAVR